MKKPQKIKVTKNLNLAPYIDHTFLKPIGDKDAIVRLCQEAKEYGFASVCVNPCDVREAVRLLKGSKVKVGTVIGFPLGATTLVSKASEAMEAVKTGARELDIVMNQRLLRVDVMAFARNLIAFVEMMRQNGRRHHCRLVLKLILECCNLTPDEITCSCILAKKAGFDFVKTSTGFGAGGATVEDVERMREAVGPKMGVKAAGGIRDRATALAMIAAGATRIGTSAGPALMLKKK